MKFFLALFLAVTAAAAETPAETPQAPRNILILNVDDLKPALGCCGDKLAKTPHIDRLAARGTLFTAAYCQQAVCAPSRISMYTGLRPDFTGIQDLQTSMRDINPDIMTLPQFYKERGYTSIGMGKVLHGAEHDDAAKSWNLWLEELAYNPAHPPALLGKFQGPEAQALAREMLAKNPRLKNPALISVLKKKGLYRATECVDLPDDCFADGALAHSALSQLEKSKADGKPFCLVLGFMKPHLPFVAPKKYWDLFKREDMPLAAWQKNSEQGLPYALHTFGELGAFSGFEAGKNPSPEQQRELIHGYYASTAFVDAQIGRVLDGLERLGLAKNTVVVLWSDHGWHLGDHGLWCKHSNFEQAVRAPLIFVVPGLPAGKVNASPVEMIDIFPTLCELSGHRAPDQLQGKSLVPVLKGEKASVHDCAVSQYPRNGKLGYSLRSGDYRLTAWMKPGFLSQEPFSENRIAGLELYDYSRDPGETRNLAEDPQSAAIRSRLLSQLAAFFKTQEHPGAGKAMLDKMASARRDKGGKEE
ncbi:MAG: hypothetical protein RL095_1 [Verrucomicrobiota bacterium]|jgi:arylsulfatase A-like enzyme